MGPREFKINETMKIALAQVQFLLEKNAEQKISNLDNAKELIRLSTFIKGCIESNNDAIKRGW